MPYKVLTESELSPQLYEMLSGCEITVWKGDGSDPADVLAQAEGLFTYSHPMITGEVLDTMPNLRVVSNFGVGVDHIDLDAAKVRGLPVGNTPGFVDGATADMTFALLMATARNIVSGHQYAVGPDFVEYDPTILHGQEVAGATLGIIGMGRIGKVVAKRASGFDMRVLYHNRNRDKQAESDLGVTYVSLDELLKTSDFVALNMPMTPETANMIAARELGLMKPTASLINVARGGVLDHDALHDALTSGQIRSAALDVTEPEPLPRDHKLLALDNIIIVPHLGSATAATRTGMAQRSADNLIAGLKNEELPSRVV